MASHRARCKVLKRGVFQARRMLGDNRRGTVRLTARAFPRTNLLSDWAVARPQGTEQLQCLTANYCAEQQLPLCNQSPGRPYGLWRSRTRHSRCDRAVVASSWVTRGRSSAIDLELVLQLRDLGASFESGIQFERFGQFRHSSPPGSL
jgi:hypothetical protein